MMANIQDDRAPARHESTITLFACSPNPLLSTLSGDDSVEVKWDEFMEHMSKKENPQLQTGNVGSNPPTILFKLCQIGSVPLNVFHQAILTFPASLRRKAPFSDVSGGDWPTELPLHEAIRSMAMGIEGISQQHIRLLLDAYPEAASIPSKAGLALHILCGYGSNMKMLPHRFTSKHLATIQDTIALLLERYPEGTLVKSGFTRKRLPIECIHECGVNKRSYTFNVCGYGRINATASDPTSPEQSDMLWNAYLSVLRATRSSEHDKRDGCSGIDGCCLLCTAMSVGASNEIIIRLLRDHPEEASASLTMYVGHATCHPLMKAIQSPCTSTETIQRMCRELPKCCKTPDYAGRFPIHAAIEHCRFWEKGIEAIFRAAPHVVRIPDKKTQLYPFLLAAMPENDSNLDTVYRLLRADPTILRNVVDGALTEQEHRDQTKEKTKFSVSVVRRKSEKKPKFKLMFNCRKSCANAKCHS